MRKALAYFFPPPLRAPAELAVFLCEQSNYLTQRASYEFCRNTLGYMGQHMFADPRFQAQERICRWDGFAAVFADALILTEGLLRPAGAGPACHGGFVAIYAGGLAAQPRPAHRTHGYAELVEAFAQRLDQVQDMPPRGVRDVFHVSARRIFDLLPIYSGNEAADREGIERAIQLGLVSLHDQLSRRLDAPALVAAIARHGAHPPG